MWNFRSGLLVSIVICEEVVLALNCSPISNLYSLSWICPFACLWDNVWNVVSSMLLCRVFREKCNMKRFLCIKQVVNNVLHC